MTSSPSSSRSEDDSGIDNPPAHNRHPSDVPELVKEGLRQSIIAKRRARGEKQLNIAYTEPQELELTPAEMEKKERRREQNRRAAQRCRNKKRLNHKSVIHNYEKVVARNHELQDELETVRLELKVLKKTLTCHSLCCPSFPKVKTESIDTIKTETLTDEEFQDSVEDSFPIKMNTSHLQQGRITCISQSLLGLTPADVASYVQAQSPTRAETVSRETLPSAYQQKFDNVVQAEMDFLHPVEPHASFAVINQHRTWQYSPTSFPPKSHTPTSCMFNESELLKSKQTHNKGQQSLSQNNLKEHHQLLLPKQPECTQSDLGHNYAHQYRSHVPTHNSTSSSTSHTSAQSHVYIDCCQLLQSQNSPCQVVPSLRSPRPSCATPRTSCSQDATRHRSMSGGSMSTSETVRSCAEETPFSSVSSEGSLYVENQVSVFQDLRTVEVPDMETDDVFLSASGGGGAPLDGHDVNNNMDIMPDNNRTAESELLQFLMSSGLMTSTAESADPIRGGMARVRDNAVTVEADDVSALMQISSDDLRFLMDNSDQPSDLISSFLSDTQRIDY